ncbi:Homeobox-leucine zipper family protein / lipid-binding START domain-containing protein isoform 4 [Theobroma cacao]|uniref:Homeobox-leucine zipper family protein / lipid-binding START domain-containing protein isoform 4 n=1 Tax=Theobroma cacao TaxID=3641 RepID=A0A061FZZ0_THECC|nr:Homeobox-leucine zipper family protein / lipid-binding START domain-containing protein isoform 4 [Theobroma cacao]
MDAHGEMGLIGENFDPGLVGRMKEDGYESRSGSDNFEGASGDDQDAADDGRPKKKKYHRHTPHQIQELESFFKECPHPDEKQRLELSRRLALESKQIKFWFQNRRTQMKNRWAEMFPCMISRVATIDVLSSATGVTRDNTLQVMDAEFQVLSPLVPVRQVRFLRFCKQHTERVWAVVDVSIDASQDAASAQMFPNCRRLPSGCVIQDMDNKYSKVTWVEHSEYDDSAVHHLLRPLLSYGFGFGAHRWLATLQRQCDCLAVLMSPNIPGEENTGITPAGRKNMLKLAQRMTYNFCAGVCASSVHKWDKLSVGNVGEDVRVMTRKNIDDPGEPAGVVLSAATSVWMPITQQRLFDFLRDERMRSQWDILSNGGPMQGMVKIAKGPGHGNCVSLLRGSAINANENNMLILQETWSDASGALVVYAPVDISSIGVVMNGGDSAYVALLPSGFAILPGISPSYHGGQSNSNGPMVKPDIDGSISGGCLLTVGFQILVNSLPTAKLTVESVETVNNLISCTIQKIKAALTVT